MADIVMFTPRSRGPDETKQTVASKVDGGEVIAFNGIDFVEMRRIMELYGFSTEGLPGGSGRR